uniref:Polyprotein n=1 Tax=Sorex caecutiens picorna-like virus TaxID=3139566 RepID=A0AB38ZKB9_9VIRU
MKANLDLIKKSKYYGVKEQLYKKEIALRQKHLEYLKNSKSCVEIVKNSPWYLVLEITAVVISLIAGISAVTWLIYAATKKEKTPEKKKEVNDEEYFNEMWDFVNADKEETEAQTKKIYEKDERRRKREYNEWKEVRDRRGIVLDETTFVKGATSHMVDVNMPCDYGIAAPIPQYIYEAVESNLVELQCEYIYKDGSTSSGRGFALMLKAQDFIFPAHYIKRSPVVSKLILRHFDEKENKWQNWNANLLALNRVNEIALGRVEGNKRHFKDVTKYFIHQKDAEAVGSIAVHRPHSGKWDTIISSSRVVRNSTVFATTDDPGIRLESSKVMMVNFTHIGVGLSNGSCGLPYIWTNAEGCRFLAGFHIAGNVSNSFGSFITKELLDSLYSGMAQIEKPLTSEYRYLDKTMQTDLAREIRAAGLLQKDLFICRPQFKIFEDMNDMMNLPEGDLKNVKPLGFVPYLYQNKAYRNKKEKVPWSPEMQNLVPNIRMPSITEYKEGLDKKFWTPIKIYGTDQVKPSLKWAQILKKEDPWSEPVDMNYVLDVGAAEYRRLLFNDDWDQTEFRLLNEFEVLNGIQYGNLKRNLTSMNASSTVGPFWGKLHGCSILKDKYLKYFESKGLIHLTWQERPEAAELRYFTSHAEDQLFEGRRPLTIYSDELKVELNEGKSRLFSAADIVEKLLFRKFFGCLMAFEAAFRHRRRTAIGADSVTDLPTFLWQARQIGDKGIFSDAERFDKHLPKEAIKKYYEVIVDFMIHKWNPKEKSRLGEQNLRTAFDVLIEMVATPLHLVDGVLYVSHRGNPSGSPMTTITNCGAAEIYICGWYIQSLRELWDKVPREMVMQDWEIEKNIYVRLLGDDFFVVLSKRYQDFGLNGKSFSAFWEKYAGIKLTSTKKDGPLEEFLPLQDGEFLSRKFKPVSNDSMVWFCALKQQSIHSALHWYTKGEERALRETYQEALEEVALHNDRAYYKKVCTAIDMANHFSSKNKGKWAFMKNILKPDFDRFVSELEQKAREGIASSQCSRERAEILFSDCFSVFQNFSQLTVSAWSPCPESGFKEVTPAKKQSKDSIEEHQIEHKMSSLSLPKWASSLEKNRYNSDVIIALLEVAIDLRPCTSTVLVMSDSGQKWLIEQQKDFCMKDGVRAVTAWNNEFRCSGTIQDHCISTLETKRWKRVVTSLSLRYPQYEVLLTRDFLQIGDSVSRLPEIEPPVHINEFRECGSESHSLFGIPGQLSGRPMNFNPKTPIFSSGSLGSGGMNMTKITSTPKLSRGTPTLDREIPGGFSSIRQARKVENYLGASGSADPEKDKKMKGKFPADAFETVSGGPQSSMIEQESNAQVEDWGGRPMGTSKESDLTQNIMDQTGSTGRDPNETFERFKKLASENEAEIAKLDQIGARAQIQDFIREQCGVCYSWPCSRCGCCACGYGCRCKGRDPGRGWKQVGSESHSQISTSKLPNPPKDDFEIFSQSHAQLNTPATYVFPDGRTIGKKKKASYTRHARMEKEGADYMHMEKAAFQKLVGMLDDGSVRKIFRAMHTQCKKICACWNLVNDIEDAKQRSRVITLVLMNEVAEEKKKSFKEAGSTSQVLGSEMAAATPDISQMPSADPPPSEVAVVGVSVGTLGNEQASLQVQNMLDRGGTMQDVASVAFNNKIPIMDIVIPVATASGTLLAKFYCDISSLSIYAKFIILAHIRWMPEIVLTAIFVGVTTYAGLLQAVLTPVDTNLTGNLLEQFLYAFNWEMLHFASTGEFGANLHYNVGPENGANSNPFWSRTSDKIADFAFDVNGQRRGPAWWLRTATAFFQAFENADAAVTLKLLSRLGPGTLMSLVNIDFINTAVNGTPPASLTSSCNNTPTSRVQLAGMTVKDMLELSLGSWDSDIGDTPGEQDLHLCINGRKVDMIRRKDPRFNSIQLNRGTEFKPLPAGRAHLTHESAEELYGDLQGTQTGMQRWVGQLSQTTRLGSGKVLKTASITRVGSIDAYIYAMDLDFPENALDAFFTTGLTTTFIYARANDLIAAIQGLYFVQHTMPVGGGEMENNTGFVIEGTNRITGAPFSMLFFATGAATSPVVSTVRVMINSNVEQYTLPTNFYHVTFGKPNIVVESVANTLQGYIDPVNTKIINLFKKTFEPEMNTYLTLEDPISGSRKLFLIFNPEQNCLTVQLSTNNPQGYNENQRSQQLYTGGNIFKYRIASVNTVPKSNSLPFSDSSLWATLTVPVSASFKEVGASAHFLGAAISNSPVLNVANSSINHRYNKKYLQQQYEHNKDLLADYNKGQINKEFVTQGGNIASSAISSWNNRKGQENSSKYQAAGNVISSAVNSAGNVASSAVSSWNNRKGQENSAKYQAMGNVASSAVSAVGNVAANAASSYITAKGNVANTKAAGNETRKNMNASVAASGTVTKSNLGVK